MSSLDRRTFLKMAGAGLTSAALAPAVPAWAAAGAPHAKKIPSSGEPLPVIGMGTWQTFNVGSNTRARRDRAEVLEAFFEGGGQIIDSSPMYGSSQDVLGWCIDRVGAPEELFAADKVWTRDGDATTRQIGTSRQKWGIARFDLMQVHNLLTWEEHLETMRRLKDEGKLRHVGVTTSHGRRHGELAKILETQELDFVQLTYNAIDREAERRLLPLARERGVAVIANRPYRGGGLVDRVDPHPLPEWAAEIDCEVWPQVLLKYIVSHPAITCAIPATTRVDHMRENMGAARGRMPDAAMRERIRRHVTSL